MRVLSILSTFAAYFLSLAHCQQNGKFRAQLVCTPKHMVVYLTAEDYEDFHGVIYIEGSYHDPDCFTEVHGGHKFMFKIPYDGCKTSEENGIYSNVLIIQHHQRIMTVDDSAFKIVCDRTNLETGAEVLVTKALHMVHNLPVEESVAEQKPKLKWLYNQKKGKTVFNEKGTFTYVPALNKTSDLLGEEETEENDNENEVLVEAKEE